MRRRTLRPLSQPPADPLEEAYEAAADARDIIRDKQRRDLPSYHGDDDEVTANVHVTVNMPQPTPSQPDMKVETETSIEVHGVTVKGLPRWAAALAVPAGLAVTAVVTWLLSR